MISRNLWSYWIGSDSNRSNKRRGSTLRKCCWNYLSFLISSHKSLDVDWRQTWDSLKHRLFMLIALPLNAYLGSSYWETSFRAFYSWFTCWKWFTLKVAHQKSFDYWVNCIERYKVNSRYFYLSRQNLWYSDCVLSVSIWKGWHLSND